MRHLNSKILMRLIIGTIFSILSAPLFAQSQSIYVCSMIITRPWQNYQPGNYGGGSGPAQSENQAKEFWASQFVSEGFPRDIFEVSCTYQGAYTPPQNCGWFC